MKFKTPPPSSFAFEIPDEWWIFAEMNAFSSGEDSTYLYKFSDEIRAVSLADIEPPKRFPGVPLLKKHRLVSLLLAFSSPDGCALPPVQIFLKDPSGPYRFEVYDGCHRFYASVAAGFVELPVLIVPKTF